MKQHGIESSRLLKLLALIDEQGHSLLRQEREFFEQVIREERALIHRLEKLFHHHCPQRVLRVTNAKVSAP